MPLESDSLVRVGRTGIEVSRLGLGTAPLGSRTGLGDAQAVETIQYALEQGIRLIDTAPMYGAGNSERRVGMALAGVPRDSYVLSTKVGRLVTPDGELVFDFTRDGVLRSVEASLERLGLDRVDILLIHDADNHYQTAITEAYPALAELREQGVVRAIGAGMNQWEMEARFAQEGDFDCFLLAGRYTLLEQRSLDSFLPLTQEKQIGVFLGGVYNSGILATGAIPGATYNYAPAPDAIVERVNHIEAVCARHGVPLQVAALRFPTAHPAVTSLLIGAITPTEVTAALAALDTPIPSALWEELRAEGLLHDTAPTPT